MPPRLFHAMPRMAVWILVHVAQQFGDAIGLAHVERTVQVARPVQRAAEGQFAVVRPFYSAEVQTLQDVLTSPSTLRACEGAPLPVDLVLYYDKVPDGALKLKLRTLLARTEEGLKECYQRVLVKYAGLSDDVEYPAAPCMQFIDMFATEPAPLWGYSAVFLMELDEQPVRSGWLDAILPVMQEAASGRAWVVGGTYNMRCMVTPSGRTLEDAQYHNMSWLAPRDWFNDGHVNGNAVYSSSPEFARWLLQLYGPRRGGPGGASERCTEHGQYDRQMYAASEQHKDVRRMWRADRRFMNCKPGGSAERGRLVHSEHARAMDMARIRGAFADAVVVHASGPVKTARPVRGT